MFSAAQYDSIYEKIVGKLSKPVTLKLNNGTGYTNYPITAYVSKYRESDLVSGGSIEIGDLKIIITSSRLPSGMRDLERKDRIEIDGRNYSIVHWDTESRAMGADSVAVEVTVRG